MPRVRRVIQCPLLPFADTCIHMHISTERHKMYIPLKINKSYFRFGGNGERQCVFYKALELTL